MNLYEGMFLLNSAESKRDWDGMSASVKGILLKHGAQILKEEHWDDRKLAYDVAGQKRGTYYLIFFLLDPLKLSALRRDGQLSEQILRQLFIRHEGTEVPVYSSLMQELAEVDTDAPSRGDGPRRPRSFRDEVEDDEEKDDKDSNGSQEG